LKERPVYVRVARLFEERSHDAGPFEDVAPAPRFEERHDVTKILLMSQVEIGVAFVESASGVAGA
jgi:hypothetical protein